MKRPHASDDVRERALAAVDRGVPVVDVAVVVGNDPSTIRRWLRQRDRTGSGLGRPRRGRASGLRPDQEPLLRRLVAEQPDARLVDYCRLWPHAAVSVPTMGRWLHRLGITRKKRH